MAAHLGGLATGFALGLFLIQPPSTSSSSSSSGELTTPGGEPGPASNWRVPAAVALGLALIAVPMIALPKPDDYLAEYKRLARIATDSFCESSTRGRTGPGKRKMSELVQGLRLAKKCLPLLTFSGFSSRGAPRPAHCFLAGGCWVCGGCSLLGGTIPLIRMYVARFP